MGTYTIIVLIVGIVFLAGTLNNWMSVKKKMAASQSEEDALKLIRELEARIVTLECIVTDKGTQLRDEIDAL
jgi:hypothetical protein